MGNLNSKIESFYKSKSIKEDEFEISGSNSEEINIAEMSRKDILSLRKGCKINIPPYSKVPEPDYKIKLLINDRYEGPFTLELKINPCVLQIRGFEGIILKKIKKKDILFIQTLKNEIIKIFIRSDEDFKIDKLSENGIDRGKLYSSQYMGETLLITCKFMSLKDCESFEFFFPFIYGIIIHTDKVKIPVVDHVDFGDFIIGSSKHILKRLDEYKDFNKNLCEIDDMEEDELLDKYEDRMIIQEREFFTRKDLELIYRTETMFGIDDNKDDQDEEKILKEKKEKYSKFFPVSITGEAETGNIITFKDISSLGNKYRAEVIEWRISINIGGKKAEYYDLPISVSKTFQLNEEHVGRYIQARIFRHIGQDSSDTYIYTEAQSNIVIPEESILMSVAELLIKGKLYRVEISTHDILLLLSVQNPTYYINLMKSQNSHDIYAHNPMVSCFLDIKHSDIKLLLPTPSILLAYFQYSKIVPLCFSYNEFILTRKYDWFGYNDYSKINDCIMKQGEFLSKVSLILSIFEEDRKDISMYFPTENDRNIVYYSVLFRQLTPNSSLEEINKEFINKKFVVFKKQFISGFKQINWKSRLLLADKQKAGTYIKSAKISNYDEIVNLNTEFY